jgi:uncharacterized membrane protein
MDKQQSALARLLHVAPIIIMTTIINSVIAFIMGWQIMIAFYNQQQYLTVGNKAVVLLIAIGTYAYLAVLPRLFNYVSSQQTQRTKS